jgi:hypothetical protein
MNRWNGGPVFHNLDFSIFYNFAVACARDQSAEIVTGDPDFKKVEHLVKIHRI